ncbi:MAG: hypothetical protein WAW17_21795 [Rhodococcus sp. (in: high G+C Gram-positive bacteria)]|uniref:hypothetical protein n=1 Tax=Rhodococcus sp. TaxID=1831 RepID=UPI003BB003FD
MAAALLVDDTQKNLADAATGAAFTVGMRVAFGARAILALVCLTLANRCLRPDTAERRPAHLLPQ